MTKILKFILLTLLCLESIAQSVTIDPSSNNSKILEVNSKNKGFMPPKMTTTERIAISNPEIGLLIFDTSKSSLYMYDGQNWLPLLPSNIDASPFLTREPNDDGAYGFGFSTDIEGYWAVIEAPYAYIDGKEVPHFRVNYILRALVLPAGEHTVEFKFHPKSYYTGNKISLASSLLLILAIAGYAFSEYRRKLQNKTTTA